MAHEQLRELARAFARDAERGELRRQRLVRGLQLLERADHLVAARELRAAAIRAELAIAREPQHDKVGEEPEHELEHDDEDEVRRAVAARAPVIVTAPEEGAI